MQHRMSAGHFSAWGAENDEVLYYMQKISGGEDQSEDKAVAPTPHQEDPIQSTHEMGMPVSQNPPPIRVHRGRGYIDNPAKPSI